jgi:hypothetical protein
MLTRQLTDIEVRISNRSTYCLRRSCGSFANVSKNSVPVSVAIRALLAKPLVKIKLLFMLASFISLVLSVSLYFNGHEQQGIYVGIWVPSILSLGSLLLAGERGE